MLDKREEEEEGRGGGRGGGGGGGGGSIRASSGVDKSGGLEAEALHLQRAEEAGVDAERERGGE
jgi:hypothetical protein